MKGFDKGIDAVLSSFDFNLDAGVRIGNEAVQAKSVCDSVNKRPEADALHCSADFKSEPATHLSLIVRIANRRDESAGIGFDRRPSKPFL